MRRTLKTAIQSTKDSLVRERLFSEAAELRRFETDIFNELTEDEIKERSVEMWKKIDHYMHRVEITRNASEEVGDTYREARKVLGIPDYLDFSISQETGVVTIVKVDTAGKMDAVNPRDRIVEYLKEKLPTNAIESFADNNNNNRIGIIVDGKRLTVRISPTMIDEITNFNIDAEKELLDILLEEIKKRASGIMRSNY